MAGEWPLWNPWLGNGTPLLANLQTALFYPPNVLYLFMPIAHAFTFSIILHLILAGLFMYLYARSIHLPPFAATISALVYMFSGYIVGRTQFVTMVNVLAWFPLLLLFSERIVVRRIKIDIIGLGLILAIQILAGHAQLWFYGLWLIGAYVVFRSWQEAHQNNQPPWPNLIKSLIWLGLALGLALLLAAIQIIPTAEFTTQSARSSGADRYFALSYSFWPWRLITLLMPNFFGNPAQGNYWGYANYWEDHAYLGTLPFLLALIAIWNYYRPSRARSSTPDQKPTEYQYQPHQVTPFFTFLIPISLILAMGWNTPIYLWVFDTIPGFGYFQAPSRLLIWYTIAMAVLAGIGAHSFELNRRSQRGWRRLLIACVGLTIAGLIGNFALPGVNLTFLTAIVRSGILLILAIMLLLIQPKKLTSAWRHNRVSATSGIEIFKSPGSRWQGLVLFFILIDLLLTTSPLIPTLPTTIFNQPIASATFLKDQNEDTRFFVSETFDHTLKFDQYFRFEQRGPLNVAYWQGLRETLVPNFGIYEHLPSANNDDPLVVGRWQQLTDLLEQLSPEQQASLLALMNIGYFIDQPDKALWPIIYETDDIAIQQVPHPLPRTYFVPTVYPVQNETEIPTRLTATDFDSRREVVIMDEENYFDDYPGQSSEKIGDALDVEITDNLVTIIEQRPDWVHLMVEAPTDGFVVLTDIFYPGWQATINDRPTKIWPANLAFRAVAVEPGRQDIVFSYRPRSFEIGLWVSGITLLIIAILGSIFLFERKRS